LREAVSSLGPEILRQVEMTGLPALLPAFCRCNCLAFLLAWRQAGAKSAQACWRGDLATFAAQMDASMVDAAPGVAGRSAQRM